MAHTQILVTSEHNEGDAMVVIYHAEDIDTRARVDILEQAIKAIDPYQEHHTSAVNEYTYEGLD